MFIKSRLIHSDILSNVGTYTDQSHAKQQLTVKYHPYFVISYVRKVSNHCHLYCITMLIMKDIGERHVVFEPKTLKNMIQKVTKLKNLNVAYSKVSYS